MKNRKVYIVMGHCVKTRSTYVSEVHSCPDHRLCGDRDTDDQASATPSYYIDPTQSQLLSPRISYRGYLQAMG